MFWLYRHVAHALRRRGSMARAAGLRSRSPPAAQPRRNCGPPTACRSPRRACNPAPPLRCSTRVCWTCWYPPTARGRPCPSPSPAPSSRPPTRCARARPLWALVPPPLPPPLKCRPWAKPPTCNAGEYTEHIPVLRAALRLKALENAGVERMTNEQLRDTLVRSPAPPAASWGCGRSGAAISRAKGAPAAAVLIMRPRTLLPCPALLLRSCTTWSPAPPPPSMRSTMARCTLHRRGAAGPRAPQAAERAAAWCSRPAGGPGGSARCRHHMTAGVCDRAEPLHQRGSRRGTDHHGAPPACACARRCYGHQRRAAGWARAPLCCALCCRWAERASPPAH